MKLKLAFVIIFLIIAVIIISADGFTADSVTAIAVFGFIVFIGWLRLSRSFAETERARSRLEENSRCEKCGKKLSYHRMPKNFGQLLLGGLTCKNCGAEFNVSIDRFMPK